jgi:ABC-type Fe3+ transport system substrate-binding protein
MIDWNNNENTSLTSVTVFGVAVRAGDRVRLWPQKSADIMDIALKGKVAVVEAIESDFDNQVHVAVVLDDDPGRDLGILRQPGHRFFFSPEEIEPLTLGAEVAHDR